MALPFDATLKDLVYRFLPDYEVSLGVQDLGPLHPVNVDLSTVTAATDIVLAHGDPPDRLVDLNFQSGPDPALRSRLLVYAALLHHRFQVPVHSIVVLLRPASDHESLTGRLHFIGRARKSRIDFRYEVIRLWKQSPYRYLDGGLGILPLAPLCRLPAGVPMEWAMADLLGRIGERLEGVPSAERLTLSTATYILLGLRLPRESIDPLFRGVRVMIDWMESSTYRGLCEDRRMEGVQETILDQGEEKFGPPSEEQRATLLAIKDRTRLKRLALRLLVATSWDELLATP